jgi:Spy/CpxP family protein refolding chaperone
MHVMESVKHVKTPEQQMKVYQQHNLEEGNAFT